MEAVIELSEVTKRYAAGGAPALEHVSLAVTAGEAVAVMGPSGSGKSTLLNLVAGLDKATGGTITVARRRVDTLSETRLARFRRRQVGMCRHPAPPGPGPVRRAAGPARHRPLPRHLPGAALRRGAAAGEPLDDISLRRGRWATVPARSTSTPTLPSGQAGASSGAAAVGSPVIPCLGLGEAIGEFTDVAGADQAVHNGMPARRHGPVIAGCAAAPHPPLRVLAPEPV